MATTKTSIARGAFPCGDAEQAESTPIMFELTADEVQSLADRLFARGISVLSLDQKEVRADLITASRALRELLRAYERGSGHTLRAIFVCGRG